MNWLALAPLRPWIALAAGTSLALNLAQLAPSLFMLQVFDRVLAGGSVETLAVLLGATLAALALGAAMDRVRALALAAAGQAIDAALAPALLHDQMVRRARGEPADAQAVADLAALRGFVATPAVTALFDAPWLPIYLGAITLADPRLGAAAALAALLLFGAALLAERLTRAPTERASQLGRLAAAEHDALLRQAEPLAVAGAQHGAVALWQRRQRELHAAQHALQRRAARTGATTRALRQALQTLLLALGALLVVAGDASPGIMVATSVLLARALHPVEQFSAGWRAWREARQAWARSIARCVAGAPAEAASAEAAGALTIDAGGALTLDRVTLYAASTRLALLQGIGLTVAPGQCLALVGPAGAGKTTLARLMLGLHPPSAGTLRLGLASPLGRAGYLAQEAPLLDASVALNLSSLAAPDAAALHAAARAAGIDEWIESLPQGYDTPLGAVGLPLSGAQRQRLGLARALYREPPLLVLDAPDAQLDADGAAALHAAVAAAKARGAVVVLVAPRPATLRLADRVAVLRQGRLEACGERDAVLLPMADVARRPVAA